MPGPIPLGPRPNDSAESPKQDGAGNGASKRKGGWFRSTLRGVGWLFAGPGEWMGWQLLSGGASAIRGLSGVVHPRRQRDQRFKVHEDGGFDALASAFSHGIPVAEFELRLKARRRQTAILAYLLFGLAVLFLLGWARVTLNAPATVSRLMLAFAFLPFCLLFFLMGFYQALLNFQIRVRRMVGWREYLTADAPFLPR